MRPESNFDPTAGFACPIPLEHYPKVLLAHGGGGTLMRQLIEKMFLPTLASPLLEALHDGAVFQPPPGRLAFTTDSYVVHPLFFPGGDIGALAVNGTVNDLAMCGAKPLYLSAGFILEEGLPMETLWRVVQSMQRAARAAKVELVTGDTKVVDRGKGDGIFINTAGIGILSHELRIEPASIEPGDKIILSGDIGRHGIAVMAVREGLAFETTIESDCAPLAEPVTALLEAGIEIHCLRDLTRGGLASALVEIAEAADLHIHIEEDAIPIREDVQGACEVLGLDPLYVANEGRFACFLPARDAEHALDILRSNAPDNQPRLIGSASRDDAKGVSLKGSLGVSRVVDMMSGEQLPRIC